MPHVRQVVALRSRVKDLEGQVNHVQVGFERCAPSAQCLKAAGTPMQLPQAVHAPPATGSHHKLVSSVPRVPNAGESRKWSPSSKPRPEPSRAAQPTRRRLQLLLRQRRWHTALSQRCGSGVQRCATVGVRGIGVLTDCAVHTAPPHTSRSDSASLVGLSSKPKMTRPFVAAVLTCRTTHTVSAGFGNSLVLLW